MSTDRALELPESSVLSVSALTALIKETLETAFCNVSVMGEISGFKKAASGHVYLTLKDEHAVLKAVIWRHVAGALRFELEDGLQVLARGDVDVYPPHGSYNLMIKHIEPRGEGALQLAFRQLVAKLQKEGLFRKEIKKPLPAFPRKIGIVTSPTGAAIRDMTNVIFRRFPLVRLYLLPTRVQGDGAAEEIAQAIRLVNQKRPDMDVLIVGRGGGSLEDLWAFNEEVVARAIHESTIPVVSAVGHEVDFSISDFVADVRAATPTEAGEIVVPDRRDLTARLQGDRERLALALSGMVQQARQRLQAAARSYVLRRPETLLSERAQRLDELFDRGSTQLSHGVQLMQEGVRSAARRLEALGPLRVLERGYSITFDQSGAVLRTVDQLEQGQRISSRLSAGWIDSEVVQSRGIEDGCGESTSEEA